MKKTEITSAKIELSTKMYSY